MQTREMFTLLYADNQLFVDGETNSLSQRNEVNDNICLQIKDLKSPYFLGELGTILVFLLLFMGSISGILLGLDALLELIYKMQLTTLIQGIGTLGIGLFAFYLSYKMIYILYLMLFYVRTSNNLEKNYNLLIKTRNIISAEVCDVQTINGASVIKYTTEKDIKKSKLYLAEGWS